MAFTPSPVFLLLKPVMEGSGTWQAARYLQPLYAAYRKPILSSHEEDIASNLQVTTRQHHRIV